MGGSAKITYIATFVGLTLAVLAAGSVTNNATAAATAVVTPAEVRVPAPISAAVAAAGALDVRSAVAVLDTHTATFYGAGDVDGEFPSESVVKILIAARLLADGKMSGETEQLASEMITQSDDDAANSLWGLVGGPDVIAWAQQRYGITDLGSAPLDSGQWGNTKFTARGLTELYAAFQTDPVVGPWLISAMHQMAATASDGTDQTFGLPSQGTAGGYKQGWGGDDDNFDSEGLNSTGYLDSDRYIVVILTQHIPWIPMSQLVPVINSLAAAVEPGGVVTVSPGVAAPQTSPLASSAPSASSAPPASSALPAAAAPPAAVAGSAVAAPLIGQVGTTAGGSHHMKGIGADKAVRFAGAAIALLSVAIAFDRLRRRGLQGR